MYFIIMKDGRRIERNMFGDPNFVVLSSLPDGAHAIEIVPEFIKNSPGTEINPRHQDSIDDPDYLVDIILTRIPDQMNKIRMIKEVRHYLGLGLRESKELVDRVPSVLKRGVQHDEAYLVKEQFEKNGGVIELRKFIG